MLINDLSSTNRLFAYHGCQSPLSVNMLGCACCSVQSRMIVFGREEYGKGGIWEGLALLIEIMYTVACRLQRSRFQASGYLPPTRDY